MSEFFSSGFRKIYRIDFSKVRDIIENYLWKSYDAEQGEIIDVAKFKFAYKLCVSTYNRLREYEDEIDNLLSINAENSPYSDEEEYERLSNMFSICRIYHEYFEFFDLPILNILADDVNGANNDKENIISEAINSTNLICDQDPDHKRWFVKVLSSKINNSIGTDKDAVLYNCLSRLFDKLCEEKCVYPDSEDKAVFIYRFSGLNGEFPPERTILWEKGNVLLGYIIRCLVSDRVNDPKNFKLIASFFHTLSGNRINLATAKNCVVNDFEKEKKTLPPDFVKAVEWLKQCGFINAEFTSARRILKNGDAVS